MALPSIAKLALIIIYVPSFLIAIEVWIVNSIYFREDWECVTCRADETPSFKHNYLYFTYWSLWLSIAVFIPWAFSQPGGKLRMYAQRIFRVALPHACTVMVTYIYYIALNPVNEFFNLDACYVLGRAVMSKKITDNMTLVNFHLVCSIISDIVLHYMSAPMLVLLVLSGELEYDLVFPYTTVFMLILGVTVGLAQTFGSKIYCSDNIFFDVGICFSINFVFHVIFALWHRRMPSFLCHNCQKAEAIHVDKDSGEERNLKNGDQGSQQGSEGSNMDREAFQVEETI